MFGDTVDSLFLCLKKYLHDLVSENLKSRWVYKLKSGKSAHNTVLILMNQGRLFSLKFLPAFVLS